MTSRAPRIVLDTNVFLRGLINRQDCASGRLLEACEQRLFIPITGRTLLAEYAMTALYPSVTKRYAVLTPAYVRNSFDRLRYLGEFIRVTTRFFDFPRDPKDAMLIDLCIAGKATHLISNDRDLLDLPAGRSETSRHFRRLCPHLQIDTPEKFVASHLKYKK